MARKPQPISAAALAVLLVCCARRPDPLPRFPRLVLWAWERPEDMQFTDPKQAAVAFLADTIGWSEGNVRAYPRLQPLRVAPGTRLIAVVRLESHGAPPPVDSVAPEILRSAALPRVEALQIDFDARSSERGWYAALLKRLRSQLRRNMPLTITALASWCESDPWIRNLPIADAIPMLFRMGPGGFWDGREFRPAVCRSSVGVSLDEPRAELPRGRRMFVFNPHSWTDRDYHEALSLEERWR
jgi:Protein of unknown function (DUF3142)